MSSTRIRYVKNADGFFESVKNFMHPTNGASYRVTLNPSENQWMIIETTTELIAATGRNTSLAKMKIEAKKALGQLGIEFAKDERAPKRTTKSSETLSVVEDGEVA